MGYLQYKVHNLSRKYEFMIEGKTLETKTHLMNVVQWIWKNTQNMIYYGRTVQYKAKYQYCILD